MRSVLVAGLLATAALLSGGCDKVVNDVKIQQSIFREDTLKISIDDDYQFKDFTKNYTGNDCTVTIHFTKEVSK